MRRFYQESWQGIPFTTFAHTHFFHLADAKFYSIFYEELFRRYQSWEDLPEVWRRNKTADSMWIASRLRAMQEQCDHDRPLRVLSIGSGVGFMERMLLKEMGPAIELYVNEPSTVCMKWLRRLIPADRIFIGQPPDCLSPDIYYDMIYLSAVDYGIPQAQLAHTLANLRYQLLPSGEILCLSASLLEEESPVAAFVNFCKNCIRGILHYIGIRKQQFWGWRRTRSEYQQLFASAGYKAVEDGFLDDGFGTYWIRAGLKDRPAAEPAPEQAADAADAPAAPAEGVPVAAAAAAKAAETAQAEAAEPAGTAAPDAAQPAEATKEGETAGPAPAAANNKVAD